MNRLIMKDVTANSYKCIAGFLEFNVLIYERKTSSGNIFNMLNVFKFYMVSDNMKNRSVRRVTLR